MINIVNLSHPETEGTHRGGVQIFLGIRRCVAAGFFVTVILSGCSMAPRLDNPVEMPPDRFRSAALEDRASQHLWWHGFGDPSLNQLIDSVIARNLDLRVAVARVAELQNRYRIAKAEQFPAVQLDLRRDQQDTPSNTGIGGQIGENINITDEPLLPERFEFTTYSASLGFAYELDFWGQARGAKQAGLWEFFASQSDARTVLMGIISETVATYFEIAAYQKTLELTRESVNILTERASVTSDRYERGLLSSLEFYATQQELDATKADLPLLESQLEIARGRLPLLLGRYQIPMDTIFVSDQAYAYSLEEIPSGLPSDLLQERPDVVAAFQRLEAARERIGVARTTQFPSFSLTGAAGTQSSKLSDLVQTSQNFWLLGTGLVAPIFNAGKIRANIRVAWAQYEQLALQYEKTVLMAFRDVEAALMHYGKLKERHNLLMAARSSAEDRARDEERRYLQGVGNYLAFLNARLNLVMSDLAIIESRRALTEARLAVHRSLGGAWIDDTEQTESVAQ